MKVDGNRSVIPPTAGVPPDVADGGDDRSENRPVSVGAKPFPSAARQAGLAAAEAPVDLGLDIADMGNV